MLIFSVFFQLLQIPAPLAAADGMGQGRQSGELTARALQKLVVVIWV